MIAEARITDRIAVPIEAPAWRMMFIAVLVRAIGRPRHRLHRGGHVRHHRQAHPEALDEVAGAQQDVGGVGADEHERDQPDRDEGQPGGRQPGRSVTVGQASRRPASAASRRGRPAPAAGRPRAPRRPAPPGSRAGTAASSRTPRSRTGRTCPRPRPARVCTNVRRSISGFGVRQLWTNQAAISRTPASVGPHERTEPKP